MRPQALSVHLPPAPKLASLVEKEHQEGRALYKLKIMHLFLEPCSFVTCVSQPKLSSAGGQVALV